MQRIAERLSALNLTKEQLIADYRVAYYSRLASLIGRKEVLSGKAKFGIFGDGKELAQVAMARCTHPGDWRSGYYRDQTLMFALDLCQGTEFFAQLYAHPSTEHDPFSGGRQMNSHFGSRLVDEKGRWKNQLAQFNSSSDISPTAGQMARLVGLAYASKLYRHCDDLKNFKQRKLFTNQGNEIAFGTIGNASTSEGLFWEALNAAGVLQIPFLISVWDDDYGISVPAKYQTTKESISDILSGFEYEAEKGGCKIFKVKGHDYVSLVETYQYAAKICRERHIPCVVHVVEMTQPQGHSTSGSHERYKSADRLSYEKSVDCIDKMAELLISLDAITPEQLDKLHSETQAKINQEQKDAWDGYQDFVKNLASKAIEVLEQVLRKNENSQVQAQVEKLKRPTQYLLKAIDDALFASIVALRQWTDASKNQLLAFYEDFRDSRKEEFNSKLYTSNGLSPLSIKGIAPEFSQHSEMVDGRQVIQAYFDNLLTNDPRVFIIGEDVGKLGGVNLEFDGLNETYGDHRVCDTGIREATILGQGIGAALRGLRPIVDIQYLDYLVYCIQGMTDDLATVHYRTAGGQICPVIVRTKGHRLEGIWHTGSPMAMILGSVRGMHVCVPRNCVQAAGLYQTLMLGQDPALVIEVLNGYRVKEKMPDNIGFYQVELGKVEILREGKDLTVVTYGANCRVAMEAAFKLSQVGIEVEVIDVQTLLPFDRSHEIVHSLMKTNAVIFLDEDAPGGASAFMMQKVLEEQKGYDFLDCPPKTLTAKAHRSAYGSDGDYYSKPNVNDVFLEVYQCMRERKPLEFKDLF